MLYAVVPGYDTAAVCCIGKKNSKSQKSLEDFDVGSENLRSGIASNYIFLLFC